LCDATCLTPATGDPKEWLAIWAAKFGWRRASLFCRLAASDDLVLIAAFGPSPLKTVWSADHPFIRWLGEIGQPVSVGAATRDERRGMAREDALKYFVEVGATLCIPLVWQEFVGILNISMPRKGWRSLWQGRLDSIRLAASALVGHRRALSQMERLRRELTLWDCTRRQFLSQMTDELKTPLNSVIGLSDALASGLDGRLTEEQVHHLAMIRASGEELLGLVNRLLDLGTLEAEAPTLHLRKVNLERLVKQRVADLELQSGLSPWNLQVEPELPGIYVDEEKIGRVLSTLMAVGKEGQAPRRLHARRKGDMVELTIQGSSPSVPLDLVVVQRIVELHGGSLLPLIPASGPPSLRLTFPTKPIGL